MSSTPTDSKLWSDVVSDSSKAFAALYNRHWKKLYNTAKYYLKDEFAAKEITQDVFITLWNKRKSLHIINFESYIHVAARYHVFTYLKKANVNCVYYIDQFTENKSLTVYNTVNDKLRYDDLQSEISQILKGLPRRCAEIFWLSRIENLTNDEIAHRLNISKRTVENQITIALRHLRLSYAELAVVLIMIFCFFIQNG